MSRCIVANANMRTWQSYSYKLASSQLYSPTWFTADLLLLLSRILVDFIVNLTSSVLVHRYPGISAPLSAWFVLAH